MPSPNAFAGTDTRVICDLCPVRTVEDALIFMATRTRDTHQMGSDPKKVLARLTAKGRMAFVLKSGRGNTIGTASITETEPAIGVVGIAVLPEFQQRGFASVALRNIERVAAEQGFIALRADIFDDNQPAVGFFTGAGYRRFSMFEKAIG